MSNENLTPEESLDLISKHISNFKVNYKEGSIIFLLWGWLLTLASFSNFIILMILRSKGAYNQMGFYSLSTWASFALIGFIILFFLERKEKKRKKVYTHLDGYIKKLWTVAGASFFIATVICIRMEINPPPIMLLIAGIATTTSGLLLKFKPLTLGGMAFFLFSIAATIVPVEFTALIVCLSIITGYLIPGYCLKAAKE